MDKTTHVIESIALYFRSKRMLALTDATKDLYGYALQSFEQFADKQIMVEQINHAMLEKYCDSLEEEGIKSASTIKQYLAIIKSWLRWATGYTIDYSYRETSEEKKKKQQKYIDRWFDEAEVDMILEYEFKNGAAIRNALLVRLLFETGARVQEIANIAWKSVDIMERTVFLRTSKTLPRPAFFSQKTSDLFNQYRSELNLDLENSIEDRDKNLFPEVAQCKKIFSEMLVDLGLKNGADGRGPHTARHYVATYLYYVGGMKGDDIATLLGDTWDTIKSIYLHPSPAILRKRVDKAMEWGMHDPKNFMDDCLMK